MRSHELALVGALACSLLGHAGHSPAESTAVQDKARATKSIRWHKSLAAAQKAARNSKKPLFVMFRCDP